MNENMTTYNLRLPSHVAESIEAYARTHKISKSSAMRHFIQLGITANQDGSLSDQLLRSIAGFSKMMKKVEHVTGVTLDATLANYGAVTSMMVEILEAHGRELNDDIKTKSQINQTNLLKSLIGKHIKGEDALSQAAESTEHSHNEDGNDTK